MDGTITRPYLDFDRIRAEIGDIEGPILEAMARMTAAQRQRAESILQRHEQEAAEQSRLNPSVTETLARLRRQRRRLAIVTRNCRQSVLFVCRKHRLAFDSIATRETGPVKPDPFGVLHVCGQMQVRPDEAVVVGDYLFDLISARRAGAKGVLYRSQPKAAEYEAQADFVIDDIGQLSEVIAALEASNGDALPASRPV
ncbi:MAG: HAD family hydrolase [Sedimentisphaerales bacterium]|nr:HAD family hydrolase [Sedimentisphaerales bacterium]